MDPGFGTARNHNKGVYTIPRPAGLGFFCRSRMGNPKGSSRGPVQKNILVGREFGCHALTSSHEGVLFKHVRNFRYLGA
jgi:hypothetical protein